MRQNHNFHYCTSNKHLTRLRQSPTLTHSYMIQWCGTASKKLRGKTASTTGTTLSTAHLDVNVAPLHLWQMNCLVAGRQKQRGGHWLLCKDVKLKTCEKGRPLNDSKDQRCHCFTVRPLLSLFLAQNTNKILWRPDPAAHWIFDAYFLHTLHLSGASTLEQAGELKHVLHSKNPEKEWLEKNLYFQFVNVWG